MRPDDVLRLPARAGRALGVLCACALVAGAATALGALMLRGAGVSNVALGVVWFGSALSFAAAMGLWVVRGRAARALGLVNIDRENSTALRQLEQAFMHAPIGKALVAPTGRFLKVNPALCRITGYSERELLERDFQSITHPEDLEQDLQKTEEVFTGKIDAYQMEKRYIHRDGRTIHVRLSGSLVRSPRGNLEVAVALIEDISQQKAAEQALRESLAERDAALARERTLMRELDHRVRNNLSGLLGLLRLYGRSEGTREEVVLGMAGKVRALTEVHDLIAGAPRHAINLRELVRRMERELVAATDEDERASRFRTAGPDVCVPPVQAAALAMILQELFANSIKHGVLSAGRGRVELEWNCAAADGPGGERRLELVWVESDGPLAAGNARGAGIGLRLIEGLARSELRGDAVFSFESPGYVCRIEALLAPEAGTDGGPSRERSARGPASLISYAHGAA